MITIKKLYRYINLAYWFGLYSNDEFYRLQHKIQLKQWQELNRVTGGES